MFFSGLIICMHPYRLVLTAPGYYFWIFGSPPAHGFVDRDEFISYFSQGFGNSWHKGFIKKKKQISWPGDVFPSHKPPVLLLVICQMP